MSDATGRALERQRTTPGPNGAATPMPKYRCHKEVWALKIAHVYGDQGEWFLVPADEKFATIVVSGYWHDKHAPEAGGYYVQYADGYTSYSPATAFEDGYTLIGGG